MFQHDQLVCYLAIPSGICNQFDQFLLRLCHGRNISKTGKKLILYTIAPKEIAKIFLIQFSPSVIPPSDLDSSLIVGFKLFMKKLVSPDPTC